MTNVEVFVAPSAVSDGVVDVFMLVLQAARLACKHGASGAAPKLAPSEAEEAFVSPELHHRALEKSRLK